MGIPVQFNQTKPNTVWAREYGMSGNLGIKGQIGTKYSDRKVTITEIVRIPGGFLIFALSIKFLSSSWLRRRVFDVFSLPMPW